MYLRNEKGLTLIENLVSVALLSLLLTSVIGAFSVSRLSVLHAKHRIVAMNTIKNYIEQEIQNGFLGGYVEGDYYTMVSSADPIPVTIDDRGTPGNTSDDLNGTITPNPHPATTTTIANLSYKTVGFVVEWNEVFFGLGPAPKYTERAVTYVAEHN